MATNSSPDNLAPDQGGVDAPVDQQLRAAREARNLSVESVALQLRLDRNIILALESADYSSLGAPVFVRGYLRSYARLVGLPEDQIAAAYAKEELEPEEFRMRSVSTELQTGRNLINYFIWFSVLVIFLGGALYLFNGDEEPVGGVDKGEFVAPAAELADVDESQPPVIAPPVQVVSELEVDESAIEAVREDDVLVDQPTAESVSPPVVSVAPEPEPEFEAAAPGPAEVVLVFSFNEECWVEIADSQKRLIYGLEKAGRKRTVRAIPPLKFFFGNAGVVDLSLDGKSFDLSQRVRRGSNTARFSLSATEINEFRNSD